MLYIHINMLHVNIIITHVKIINILTIEQSVLQMYFTLPHFSAADARRKNGAESHSSEQNSTLLCMLCNMENGVNIRNNLY